MINGKWRPDPYSYQYILGSAADIFQYAAMGDGNPGLLLYGGYETGEALVNWATTSTLPSDIQNYLSANPGSASPTGDYLVDNDQIYSVNSDGTATLVAIMNNQAVELNSDGTDTSLTAPLSCGATP